MITWQDFPLWIIQKSRTFTFQNHQSANFCWAIFFSFPWSKYKWAITVRSIYAPDTMLPQADTLQIGTFQKRMQNQRMLSDWANWVLFFKVHDKSVGHCQDFEWGVICWTISNQSVDIVMAWWWTHKLFAISMMVEWAASSWGFHGCNPHFWVVAWNRAGHQRT